MSILTRVRHGALAMARDAGLFRAVGRSHWRRRRLCILCFHGIAMNDEHLWRPGLYMTPQQFQSRMHSLAAIGANVLPLGEAVLRLRAGTLPPRAVVITFDDGCHDFHTHALPAIDAAGFPSTVYLTTYYAERPEPVLPLVLDYLLWKSGRAAYPGWPALDVDAVPDISTESHRRSLSVRVAVAIRRGADDPARREELLDEFASQVGCDVHVIRQTRMISIMSADEVRDAAVRGVGIELHTHRHRTPRDRDRFLMELSDNRAAIRQITGTDPRHFCYPSGDVDQRMLPWLAEAGVQSATTCQVALATAASNPFLLPRFLDSGAQPASSYEGWVTGAAAFMSRQQATPGGRMPYSVTE